MFGMDIAEWCCKQKSSTMDWQYEPLYERPKGLNKIKIWPTRMRVSSAAMIATG